MAVRADLLLAFRASFDELERARLSRQDEGVLRHAERNFYANAEGLARLVPRMIENSAIAAE